MTAFVILLVDKRQLGGEIRVLTRDGEIIPNLSRSALYDSRERAEEDIRSRWARPLPSFLGGELAHWRPVIYELRPDPERRRA